MLRKVLLQCKIKRFIEIFGVKECSRHRQLAIEQPENKKEPLCSDLENISRTLNSSPYQDSLWFVMVFLTGHRGTFASFKYSLCSLKNIHMSDTKKKVYNNCLCSLMSVVDYCVRVLELSQNYSSLHCAKALRGILKSIKTAHI